MRICRDLVVSLRHKLRVFGLQQTGMPHRHEAGDKAWKVKAGHTNGGLTATLEKAVEGPHPITKVNDNGAVTIRIMHVLLILLKVPTSNGPVLRGCVATAMRAVLCM